MPWLDEGGRGAKGIWLSPGTQGAAFPLSREPRCPMTATNEKALGEKRSERLKGIQEEVRTQMIEPWTNYLQDLVKYKQMHACGLRISEIDHLIQRELRKQIPN